MSFIGRKNFKKTGRIQPSLRFRKHELGDRVRPKTSGSFLTPVGWVVTVGGLALTGFLAWFFVFSTNFLVRQVEITEPASLTQEQLDSVFYRLQDQRVLFWVPGNHIVFISASRLSRALNESYPYIAGVENFKRQWPDKVSFSISQKTPVFVYTSQSGQRFLIDDAGTVIGEPLGELQPGLTGLEGITETPVFGEKLTKFMPLILALQKDWRWSAFKPTKFAINNSVLILSTSEGWHIKISDTDKPGNVIKNLGLILDNEIKSLRSQLAYVDLRLTSRAFFCLKGQPCAKL